jgi:hypothetical protein
VNVIEMVKWRRKEKRCRIAETKAEGKRKKDTGSKGEVGGGGGGWIGRRRGKEVKEGKGREGNRGGSG